MIFFSFFYRFLKFLLLFQGFCKRLLRMEHLRFFLGFLEYPGDFRIPSEFPEDFRILFGFPGRVYRISEVNWTRRFIEVFPFFQG